jgi:hypothetical protein
MRLTFVSEPSRFGVWKLPVTRDKYVTLISNTISLISRRLPQLFFVRTHLNPHGSLCWFSSCSCPITFAPHLLNLLYRRSDASVNMVIRVYCVGILPGHHFQHPWNHEESTPTEPQHRFPSSQCLFECWQLNSSRSYYGGNTSHYVERWHFQCYVRCAIMDDCERNGSQD